MNVDHTCPFCRKWASRDYVVQGRGRRSNKQYVHRVCFENAVKQRTYWEFMIK